MGFNLRTLVRVSKNPSAYGLTIEPGRLAGLGRAHGQINTSSPELVCPADGYQPALAVPAEGGRNEGEVIAGMSAALDRATRIVQENIQRAKAAREPAALLDLRLRQLDLTKYESDVLDAIERKRKALSDKKRRKEKILPSDELTPKEEAQYKLLSKSRAGQKYAEKHKGQRLTPKQVQQMAQLAAQASEVASAQDRIVEALRGESVVSTNKSNTTWISGGAMFVQNSGNEKIMDAVGDDAKGSRNTATTYAAINPSCPKSCMQRGVACYAETSNNIRPIVLMLEHIARELGHDAIAVAQDEANAIDASFPKYKDARGREVGGILVPTDLRIHTVGDAQKPEAVRIIVAAAERWLDRSEWTKNPKFRGLTKPAAWSYTHAWKMQKRSDWGRVGILASIQTVNDVKSARERGFAPTVVVPGHFYGHTTEEGKKRWERIEKLKPHERKEQMLPGRDFVVNTREGKDENGNPVLVPYFSPEGMPILFPIEGTDVQWFPCPAQNPDPSKRVGCVTCRKCFDDADLLDNNVGVAFQAHASGKVRGVPFQTGEYEVEYAMSMASKEQAKAVRELRGKVSEEAAPERPAKLSKLSLRKPEGEPGAATGRSVRQHMDAVQALYEAAREAGDARTVNLVRAARFGNGGARQEVNRILASDWWANGGYKGP